MKPSTKRNAILFIAAVGALIAGFGSGKLTHNQSFTKFRPLALPHCIALAGSPSIINRYSTLIQRDLAASDSIVSAYLKTAFERCDQLVRCR